MKYLLIISIICCLFSCHRLKANDLDHLAAGALIGGSISAGCKYKLRHAKTKEQMPIACAGLGIAASIIAATVFEMTQSDYNEAGHDIAVTTLGAVLIQVPIISIDF